MLLLERMYRSQEESTRYSGASTTLRALSTRRRLQYVIAALFSADLHAKHRSYTMDEKLTLIVACPLCRSSRFTPQGRLLIFRYRLVVFDNHRPLLWSIRCSQRLSLLVTFLIAHSLDPCVPWGGKQSGNLKLPRKRI